MKRRKRIESGFEPKRIKINPDQLICHQPSPVQTKVKSSNRNAHAYLYSYNQLTILVQPSNSQYSIGRKPQPPPSHHLAHLPRTLLPPHPPTHQQRGDHGPHERQDRQRPPHGPPPGPLHHEPAPDGPDEQSARERRVEEAVRRRVRAAAAEDARAGALLDVDDVRDLCEEGRHGHTERDAEASEEGAQECDLGRAGVVDGAHGDEEGDSEEEARGGGDAGPALVAPVADQGRREGGED